MMSCVSDKPRVTLKRIAEEAGVSPMTVSNAFNRPDPLAGGLRRGRASALGLISDTNLSYACDGPAASALVAGLCAAAEDQDLGLLLVPPGGPAPSSSAVVDGIVVYSVAQEDPLPARVVAHWPPAVVIDQPAGTGLPGPADLARRASASYAVSRACLDGYAAALARAGIDWAQVTVHECGGSFRPAGRAATAGLLAAPDPPTAILATSDVLALGVLDAAADAGLTTIRQDHHAKGRLAGELLLSWSDRRRRRRRGHPARGRRSWPGWPWAGRVRRAAPRSPPGRRGGSCPRTRAP
jgi:DNA-binding LacI/PurR family transcriptional regulator